MSSTDLRRHINSPYGRFLAIIKEDELCSLVFEDKKEEAENDDHPLFDQLINQLEDYFNGKLKKFDIPLNPQGTTFQKRVWAKLRGVPFGARISYAELAEIYGEKKAVRAVAAANGANPITILIPCHRIIGSHGKLTGYAWGLERKKRLLQHEMKFTPQHDLFG
jgi:methylated-DNA-[protein]-cysteine S-methyltransferase